MTVKFINTPYLLYKGDLTRQMFSNPQLSDAFEMPFPPEHVGKGRAMDMIWAQDVRPAYQQKYTSRWKYEAEP